MKKIDIQVSFFSGLILLSFSLLAGAFVHRLVSVSNGPGSLGQSGNINRIPATASGWTIANGRIFPTNVANILTATTSIITGPSAQYVLRVLNPSVEGGGFGVLSDQTEYVYHTFAVGRKSDGLFQHWLENNGDAVFSNTQGSTTIGLTNGIQKSKFLVSGNAIISTSTAERDGEMNDDSGLHVGGDLSIGIQCLDHTENSISNRLQVCGDGFFTGSLNVITNLTVSGTLTANNGTGSLGQLLSINSSGLPVWVSTSTLGFSSVPAYYTQSPSSKFLGGMFDDWMVPGDLNGSGVSLATGAYTANQISAVHVVFPRSGTIVGWKAMTAINGGANSTVLCGLYNSNPYPTTLVGSATAVSTATSAADAMATTSIPFNAGGYDVVGFSSTTPQVRGQGIGGYDKVYGTTQGVLAWNTSISSTTAPLTGNLPANFPIAGAVRANGVAPGSGCLMQVVYN